MSSQSATGHVDYAQDLYLAHGAEHVGEPEVDETTEIAWVPVDERTAMIAKGDILGAITIGCSLSCCGGQPLAYLRGEVPAASTYGYGDTGGVRGSCSRADTGPLKC
jgi:hypothetical protein